MPLKLSLFSMTTSALPLVEGLADHGSFGVQALINASRIADAVKGLQSKGFARSPHCPRGAVQYDNTSEKSTIRVVCEQLIERRDVMGPFDAHFRDRFIPG
jgi:hypothetical protein